MIKKFAPIEGRNAEIIESVMTCGEIKDLPEEIKFKLHLCVEEVEENVLCYSGSTWVEVEVERTDEMVAITFRDEGVKFDPLTKEDPDINASLEDRPIGGLGIFLCKQMMDEISYNYVKNCNALTMKKLLK